jgi:hypothetical protein
MTDAPHTVRFRVLDPDQDVRRILAALRAYWKRTGYLPRLERIGGVIWLRAPDDVFVEWMMAFGMPAQPVI